MRRLVASLGRQQHIPGTHGQSRLLPYRRTRDDLRGQEKLLHHLRDDRQLLVILLAEISPIGPDEIEQLQDDRQDALKEPRPVRSFHYPRAVVRLDPETVPVRIQFRRGRREYLVGSKTLQKFQVVIERTRVSGEIARVVELRRVYENADHNDFVLTAASLHQRSVSLVKRAHCRDETDTAPGEGGPPVQPAGDAVPNLGQE